MRTNLQVPFADKDQAKKLGARWDAARKVWYVENKTDMAPFSRWAPSPHVHSGAGEQPPKSPPGNKLQAAGKVIVGSDYVVPTRICQCLPWDVCDKCQATALSN
ncbi:DUF5710 domain-containing protein [Azonexus sp. IMCC34842]|uniref:DUF5710 domain-containing protein n=1 Tax=Azonexus sp. IMCC34842 TaxID=3420950 RepID=UPI003D149FEC